MKSTFWSIQEPLKENTWTSIRRIINNVSVQTIYFSKKMGFSFILQKKGKRILIGYNLDFFIHS